MKMKERIKTAPNPSKVNSIRSAIIDEKKYTILKESMFILIWARVRSKK